MDPAREAAGKLGSYAYTNAPSGDRSITDVLKDTITNIQEIIRSEVQLAKVEVKEEVRKAGSAGISLAIAAIAGLFGLGFCLLCAVYALALVLPAWAAALIVGVVLLIAAAVALSIGRKQLKTIKGPTKTVFTVKEDVEWMRNQSKS